MSSWTRDLEKARSVTSAQLKRMTPTEVDNLISAVHLEQSQLMRKVEFAVAKLHKAVGDIYREGSWSMSFAEVEKMARRITSSDPKSQAASPLREREEALKSNSALALTEDKLHAEYVRRGEWPRCYLVTGGHAHRADWCSSLHKGGKRTPLFWLTEYSGKSMDEIVEAAGERACTICYPDAPVSKGLKAPQSVLLTPEEEEQDRKREEQAARRAEKKAKAALAAITQPDGTALRERVSRDGKQTDSVVKTLSTARSRLKDFCWYQYAWGDDDGGYERNIQHLARSVAWREGDMPIGSEPSREQIEAVISPIRAKAIKEVDKARKEGR